MTPCDNDPTVGDREATTTSTRGRSTAWSAALPATVGVYGGGRMGAGIAHAFLTARAQVVIVEVDGPAADAARERVERYVALADSRGGATRRPDEILASFRTATEASALAGCGLVVEAVPESVDLKTSVLKTVESAAPEAVIATNTSSLSVDGLAAGLTRPDRFIGLHFFNPVPARDRKSVV